MTMIMMMVMMTMMTILIIVSSCSSRDKSSVGLKLLKCHCIIGNHCIVCSLFGICPTLNQIFCIISIFHHFYHIFVPAPTFLNGNENTLQLLEFKILCDPIEDKEISARESIDVVDNVRDNLTISVFELKDSFAEVWDDNPGDSADEEDDGDGEKEDPPHVDHQEVMLVEDVVGENTEQVVLVHAASESTNLDLTGDFCGEKVAFGVYKFMFTNSFLRQLHVLHVIEHVSAIGIELAVKELVANCEAGNDSNNIKNFTQKELDVIDSVLDLISLVAFLHKFFPNFLSVIAPDQRCYEVSFKTLPDSSRHLGKADESHEKERKPKIVSYGCFVFIRSLLICHTFGHTSSLESLGHMTNCMTNQDGSD